MRSAPAATTARTSSPRRAKSADRILGAMRRGVIAVLDSSAERYNIHMDSANKYHVTVSAKAFYVEDQSDPEKDHYVFGYTIKVTNSGVVPAQLISRHWLITDSNHRVEE